MIEAMRPEIDDDAAEISAIRAALEAAENAGDADRVSALLADDAVLMVPDFPVQEGRVTCTAFLREMMVWLAGGFDRRITYTSAEVAVTGDAAFDRGTFAFTISPRSGGRVSRVTGKYLWMLRRTAEKEWKVTRLIASRDEDRFRERAVAILPGDDLGTARDFYVAKLGFAVQFEATDDGISGIMGLERDTIELTVDCPMSGHGRHVCVSLRVNSADALYEEWRHVVDIPRPPRDETWSARTFGVQDPFGNTIFVIGPPLDEPDVVSTQE